MKSKGSLFTVVRLAIASYAIAYGVATLVTMVVTGDSNTLLTVIMAFFGVMIGMMLGITNDQGDIVCLRVGLRVPVELFVAALSVVMIVLVVIIPYCVQSDHVVDAISAISGYLVGIGSGLIVFAIYNRHETNKQGL